MEFFHGFAAQWRNIAFVLHTAMKDGAPIEYAGVRYYVRLERAHKAGGLGFVDELQYTKTGKHRGYANGRRIVEITVDGECNRFLLWRVDGKRSAVKELEEKTGTRIRYAALEIEIG